jgi:hypothetical protein
VAGPFRNRIDRAELLAAEPSDEPPRVPGRALPAMTRRSRRFAFAAAACGFVAWFVFRRDPDTGSFALDLTSLVGAIVVATLSYYAVYVAFLCVRGAQRIFAALTKRL